MHDSRRAPPTQGATPTAIQIEHSCWNPQLSPICAEIEIATCGGRRRRLLARRWPVFVLRVLMAALHPVGFRGKDDTA
jgi:hypothetical protein